VGESRVEWDTEVVPILSEGEWLKFVDFFDLLDEILALDGFVGLSWWLLERAGGSIEDLRRFRARGSGTSLIASCRFC
jgi:hypothetical protein